jgi:hypothetical protein
MRALAALFLGAVLLLGTQAASAQEQSAVVRITPAEARVGERVTLTIEVVVPAGSAVELDLAATELGAAEIAEALPVETVAQGDEVLHTLAFRVTGFEPGQISVRPAVRVTDPEGAVNTLALPPAAWQIVSVLAPGETPQDIRGLQPQMTISGKGFAYTRELIAIGAAAVAVLLVSLAVWLLRRYLQRPRPQFVPEEIPAQALARGALDELNALEPSQDALPSIYSRMAGVVRRYLGAEYRFPASSLTARELEAQMVNRGVHRWQARMATSLLAECDAVAYAGYRPAAARWKADQDMAYQNVGVSPEATDQAQIISFQRPGDSE